MLPLIIALAVIAAILAVAAPTSATITRILDPTTWRERQINTLKSVGDANYKTGIARPRDDPIKAGIKAEPAFADAMKKVVDGKLRAAGLGTTNMEEWYKFTSEIGAGRLVDGVTKRETKVEKFLNKYQPLLKAHVDAMDKLATGTDAERKEKMIKNLEGLKALHGKA